ncbi:MAG: 3-hydroxybutyryl-CoA dehydrogenase [Acidaminococcales bacterium]|jgi:3-hydroxybutyryl-CoA dehydrogenase|nr:3-hydroxybutyryl-CoA dehydrogenase [Acidaminococcales bacterium]
MDLLAIKKIGVVGSGLMGNGIAQIVAAAGYGVVFCDISQQNLDKGYKAIAARLEKEVKNGKRSSASKEELLSKIKATVNYEDLADIDYLYEAVFEEIRTKKELYGKISKICQPACIFSTNTSGLSISEIASVTDRPDKFIGTHFFNPVPVMKLLEIIRGYDTSDATYETAVAVGKSIGKEIITVAEAPLFCVNRILVPMLNEAMFVLSEGIATKEDIDKGMALGANHPIGPLALADLVGLDTLLQVIKTLYEETGDSKYRPCPLLVKMVRAGKYGRKNGKGFYAYN